MLEVVDGVLDAFSEEERGELVGTPLALKLALRLCLVPCMDI